MLKKKLQKIPLGVKAAVVYTIASVFSRGLAMITVPIFTRIMTTSEIGMVNLYNSWYSLLSVVATLSLTSGGFQAAMKEFEGERDQYQSSVLTLTSIMAVIFACVYFAVPNFWNRITGLPPSLIILMLIVFFFVPAQDFWLLRQRYEYKYKLAGTLTICSALVSTILAVIVVLSLNKVGSDKIVIGRLYATNIISIIISSLLWFKLYLKGKTIVNIKYWNYSLKLSVPLIGYAFSAQILNVSDRMMISKMIGNNAVGIYSTLYTVSSISLLVWSAINSSFIPYLYQNIGKKDNKIKELSLSLMGAYAIIAVMLAFLAPEIVKILATNEYYEAIYIMPPIAAGVFLTSVSNMYSNLLIYYKKTKYIMYSSVIAATVNVILNYICIQKFGYMAAAYTTLIAYIVLAGVQVIFARKINFNENGVKSVYNDRAILFMSILTIIATLFGLIFYRYTVLRYILTFIGMVVGLKIALMALKKLKKNC